MRLNRRYAVLWSVITAAWLAVEAAALMDPDPGDTFTEMVRTLLQLGSRTQWAGRIFAICFLAWLCWHFLYPKKGR